MSKNKKKLLKLIQDAERSVENLVHTKDCISSHNQYECAMAYLQGLYDANEIINQ